MANQIKEYSFIPKNKNDTMNKIKHSKTIINNMNNTQYSVFTKNKVAKHLDKEKSKNFLIAHKINIKDNNNDYYKKGLNDIFYDANYYLSNKYFNHKVKIGNSSLKDFSLSTSEEKINKFKKDFLLKKNNYLPFRKLSTINVPLRALYRNSSYKSRIMDSSNMSILSKYDYKKPLNNDNIKRPSLYVGGKEYITDGELKLLYQKYKDNEKKLKSNIKSRNERKNFISKYSSTFYNTASSIQNEINNRLTLQEKILNNFKRYKKLNQFLSNKIIKKTKKDNKDLLMYKVNSHRNIIEKNINNNSNSTIDGDYEYHSQMIQWLSNLRHYKIKNKSNSENKNNNTNLNQKNFNKTMINPYKEKNLNNYINKYHYSFGNNSYLYSDIESSISPLYALIIPDNSNCQEIIKNSSIEDANKVIKKNELNKDDIMILEGKNLLDYEIKLSKILEGKKKYIIKNNYKEDDIKPLTFSRINFDKKYNLPKAVINSFNLHIYK